MARQKESERKQVESLNRKHLAGLRVVQKNLVYVVGLNPKSREEDLLQTLRGDQYFGQYGKIVKIVVSKAKENANGNSSIGVYVTFARKQDAASCIAAVDGSQNGDRTLRWGLIGLLIDEIYLLGKGRNMGRPNIARHISAMKHATIAIACFSMNKARIMTASAGKTSRPLTLFQHSVLLHNRRQAHQHPNKANKPRNLSRRPNKHLKLSLQRHIQWRDKEAEMNR